MGLIYIALGISYSFIVNYTINFITNILNLKTQVLSPPQQLIIIAEVTTTVCGIALLVMSFYALYVVIGSGWSWWSLRFD